MAPLPPRQTFIALRARRQGHQIARDILYPHIDLLGPQSPQHYPDRLPGDSPRWTVDPELLKQDRRWFVVLAALGIVLIGLLVYLTLRRV
ncbi:hypothetical protein [Fontivita pretiosa]|uniref:hypothetical protein n=1 Tax=Fontivita pretiosa TaxID=2989684 RepID=UPI003D16A935